VHVTGPTEGGFAPVRYRSVSGWASTTFLAQGDPPPAPQTPKPSPTAVGFDDYPYKGRTGDDPWGFAGANCTSFVAWRINHYLGIPFQADMGGAYFGDAAYWDGNAAALGYRVDELPTPGSIAQWRGDETV